MKRLAPLDYLRGIAAFGIMFYHYTMWTMGDYTAADFLGRAGVYCVVIFYILSGITLYHVYENKIGAPSRQGLADFAIRRFARIFPLLWLMTIATLLIKREDFPSSTIVLNLTGLFGVYHWWDTVCYGAWSIGNELVFYLFFPMFIFLLHRSRAAANIGTLLTFLIFLWFTFKAVDTTQPVNAVFWTTYINPLNQVSYFLAGLLIARFASNRQFPAVFSATIIVVSLLAFIFYPASGSALTLVTGLNRILFTTICITLCLGFYMSNGMLPRPLHFFFSTLGEISYSVYLSHPLVTFVLSKVLRKQFPLITTPAVITCCIVATIVISWIVYHLYEKPFIRMGKKISNWAIGRLF